MTKTDDLVVRVKTAWLDIMSDEPPTPAHVCNVLDEVRHRITSDAARIQALEARIAELEGVLAGDEGSDSLLEDAYNEGWRDREAKPSPMFNSRAAMRTGWMDSNIRDRSLVGGA